MRSTDGGTTWETLSDGLGSYVYDVRSIDVSPTNPDDVVLCACRLFKWDPDKARWEVFGFDADDAAFAPTDASRIYVCDYNCLYFSDDAGESWQVYPEAQRGHSVAVSHYDRDKLLVADLYTGVWRSDDGCETLSFASDGIAGIVFNDLVACDADMRVLVSCAYSFVMRSSDGGNAWRRSMTGYYSSYYPLCMGQDPSNLSRLFLADPYCYNFYESDDAGETWDYVSALPYAYYVNDIAVDYQNPERIYLAVTYDYAAAYRSVDGGLSWQELNLYLGGAYYYEEAYFVRIDSSDSTRIYVGTSQGLYLSQDDGESFGKVRNLGGFVPDLLRFDPWDSRTIYCGRNTTSDAGATALCVSSDGGGTWAPVDTPVTAVCAMAINPDDSDEFYIAGDHSLHHTIDAGEVWLPLAMDGFDCPVSTAVLVDFGEAGNTVYATGYGVYSLFDVGTPFISLSLSQTSYAAGDTFRLSCNVTSPGASREVDLVVWIELPGGANIYLPGMGTNRAAFYSGWLPGHLSLKDYTLLEARVGAGLPSGQYTVFAVLCEQGTDEQVSDVAVETFTIIAGIE